MFIRDRNGNPIGRIEKGADGDTILRDVHGNKEAEVDQYGNIRDRHGNIVAMVDDKDLRKLF